MNEIINTFLLSGHKFMPVLRLRRDLRIVLVYHFLKSMKK